MPSTTELLRAIRAKNFLEAKDQFSSIIQDKMRTALANEYQEAAKTIGVRESTERTPMNEAVSWQGFIEFFVYYNGTQLANYVISVLVALGAIIALSVPGWISTIAKKYSAWIRESERAYKIYEMKKELTPEQIQQSIAAAKAAYGSFGPQAKYQITRLSNQLKTADLESESGKQQAAKLMVDLAKFIKSDTAA